MIRPIRLCFAFLLCLSTQLFAQKFNWAKPTPTDLALKEVRFEPDANVVILFDEGEMTVEDGECVLIKKRRLKILKPEGLEAAEVKIPFYRHKGLERVYKMKAHTINNGEIIEVDKSKFFDVEVNQYWSEKRFTFPKVRVGSILEYEYRLRSKNLTVLEPWYFQNESPTMISSFDFSSNMLLDYGSLLQGKRLVAYDKKKKNKSNSKWILKDIPSVKSINHVYNVEDHREKVRFQLAQNNYSGSEFATDWTAFSKELNNLANEKTRKKKAKEFLAGIPQNGDELSKLKAILKAFKSRFKWNRFYSTSPRLSSKEFLESSSGNSADMNVFLHKVLEVAGFNTDLVLLSTRAHGKVSTTYPLLDQFNSIINLVQLSSGKLLLIDAIKFYPEQPEFLRLQDCNHIAFLLNAKKDKRWLQLNMNLSQMRFNQKISFKENKTNYAGIISRQGYFLSDDYWKPKGVISGLFSESQVKELDDKDGFKRLMYKSDRENLTDEIIVLNNPFLDKLTEYQNVDKEREEPLEFNFPIYLQAKITIYIQENQEIVMPDGFQVQQLGENYSYSQKALVSKNKAMLIYEYAIKTHVLGKKDIPAFVDFQSLISEAISKQPIIKPK